MRGSGKINRLELRGKKTLQNTSCIVQPRLTNEKPILKELDLEPTAKRGTDTTDNLVNLN